MKVVLLLALVLVGAYAQTVTNWDLSEISPDSGIVEADKKPELTGQARKASNQGYTARYTQQGKTLKMSLTVHKETSVRVTDTDRLLFGMEGLSSTKESEMANITLSYGETASICEAALGSTWETMVHLPTEDLTYLEALRLSTSLNEYNLLNNGNSGAKGPRAPPSGLRCICHGTAHHFQTEGQVQVHDPPFSQGGTFKDNGPFWGVRILDQNQKGHGLQTGKNAHEDMPYGENRDCMLCDDFTNRGLTDDDIAFDCRYCCFGKCVVKTGVDGADVPETSLKYCDFDYLFDTGRPDSPLEADYDFNRYRINDIQQCRLPVDYTCDISVKKLCSDCTEFISELIFDNGTLIDETKDCDYCNAAVGSHYHCVNCSQAIEEIQIHGAASEFPQGDQCTCEQAFWQIANGNDDTGVIDWAYDDDDEEEDDEEEEEDEDDEEEEEEDEDDEEEEEEEEDEDDEEEEEEEEEEEDEDDEEEEEEEEDEDDEEEEEEEEDEDDDEWTSRR